MVPDAVVFVNDNPFFIEYDRATERQTILLSKIFGYAEEPAFENSSLFFVFENNRKDNTQVSKRLMNFLEYVNEVEVEGVTGHDMLKRKNISYSVKQQQMLLRYCRNHSRKDAFKS